MNISSAKQHILAAMLADDAVIMEGKHGIGKSQIVEQIANEQDYHLETLFLSHQEVGDVIGIPNDMIVDGVKCTVWSVPIWLQRMNMAAKEGKKCILFLDELNRAQLDVRQSALQLVLERRIHEHELPTVDGERTMVVAAINPSDDEHSSYQVDELDAALLDRFLHVSVEADLESWLDWARTSGVHQMIRDFLTENPDRLHYTPKDGSMGTAPRSWAKLSNYLHNVDKISEDIMPTIFKGKLGEKIANQFYSFYLNYVDVVKMDDVIELIDNNKHKYNKIEDLAEVVAELMSKSEVSHKHEMAELFKQKYEGKEDKYAFLTYIYSLEPEIKISFLKKFKENDAKNYHEFVAYDKKINDKKLFLTLVRTSKTES